MHRSICRFCPGVRSHAVTLVIGLFQAAWRLLSLGLVFAAVSAAQTTIQPTTTLAIETGNNTSAASSFTAQNDGNSGAANVSKVATRNLLYSGSTTNIYAHLMTWFGESSHENVGYTSGDPTQIHAQVVDMLSRGIQGAILDWSGPSSTVSNTTALNMRTEAESHNGSFVFAIQEDPGALDSAAKQNGCDITPQLISDLTYAANNFESSSAYLRIGGRPVVFFYDITKYYLDWDRLHAGLPLNPVFISLNKSSFSLPQSSGAFSWVTLDNTNPYDVGLSYLNDFYSNAVHASGQYALGAVYKGFNDSLASWGTNRFMHQQCGVPWLTSFSEIGKYYSSSNQLYGLQVVTWNDYEEGTEIETGIDNCLSISPVISGATLTWSVQPDPALQQKLGTAQISESTVDHYTVFISTDGQNLMSLAQVPSGTHALDLSQYGLAAGDYVLYVKAVGVASIKNTMSPAVSFNPAQAPPVAKLSVTPVFGVAPLSVSASTSASTDSDGTISSSQIDFGDGMVQAGPTATHTYADAGPYTLLATVKGSNGLAATTATNVDAAALAQPGVAVSAPASGTALQSNIHVVADAVTSKSISSFTITVDGNYLYTIDAPHIDTQLKLSPGAHALQFQATDSAGNNVASKISGTVQSTSSTPSAQLALSTVPNTPADTVLACTANSSGNITHTNIDFGDGTNDTGVAALHTYADSQPHTVTATVTAVDGQTSIAIATADGSGPDFTFAMSPANASLQAGQQATVNLNLGAMNGTLSSAISLACSGLPAGATCSFSPSSVTPGSGTASSKLTISTAGATAQSKPMSLRHSFPFYALILAWPGVVLVSRQNSRGRRRSIGLISILLMFAALQIGCGSSGSGSGSKGGASATPAGTYTISVTANAGSIQHKIPFTLLVE